MPIYEYRCDDCGRPSTIFVRSLATYTVPACPRCKTGTLRKLVSRFAVLKGDEARAEALADPSSFADVDENDPKSLARWARRFGKEMGEDLGDDFDEVVDQLEAGEMPDDEGDGAAGEGGLGEAAGDE